MADTHNTCAHAGLLAQRHVTYRYCLSFVITRVRTQVYSLKDKVKMLTFDADDTLYDHGMDLEARPPPPLRAE
jgi:hypothetical protein